MHFETTRSTLLNPLKVIAGIVERKHTLPILGHVLLSLEEDELHLRATDAEIEVDYKMPIDAAQMGVAAAPAIKLFDICRSLPDDVDISFTEEEDKLTVKSGRSRFSLACLPAEDFPATREDLEPQIEFNIPQRVLKNMLAKTGFAMATQDVRYYLNGMLLDLPAGKEIFFAATDGHRMAIAAENFDLLEHEAMQAIIPRKTIAELARNLDNSEDTVSISVGESLIRFTLPHFTMTSKLIDGKFPDYQSVIPASSDKTAIVDVQTLKQAITRAVILSDARYTRYKGVKLSFSLNKLVVSVRNTNQETAEEELDAEFNGDRFDIGFNAAYLLDTLNAIETSEAEMFFTDENSSCLVLPRQTQNIKYVIMPIRL